MRRFLVMLALVAMTIATAAPVAARERELGEGMALRPSERFQASKSLSGRIAQSDEGLLARNDSRLVNVMIKFDLDAVASYQGGVEGLAPTSPSATGKTLKENSAAAQAYRRYIDGRASTLRRSIRATVPGMTVGNTFLDAFGGMAARIPANKAKDLLEIQGVSAVMYDNVAQPLTDASPAFIGADQVWPGIGGSTTAGEGVIVGVLDTGIWPEYPSFADPGIDHPGGSYGCEFGDGVDPDFGADFTCNDKLIGAYAFLETQMAFTTIADEAYCNDAQTECSARDADGHGTHTSSTAAGNSLASAELYGVERGPISGIAPGAHVIHYRVCIDGCFSSDSVDAVEQAIIDGVDVINFSISGGSNAYSDPVELAFLDAYAAGITVNASAGNDGPGAATANHAGPWVNTVGASTSDRHFLTTLHLSADNSDTLDIEGVTVTAGIGSPMPVVLGRDTASDELCDIEATAGDYTGTIVACQRGAIARVLKSYNVDAGGAAGMILYNVSVTDLETDNHYLPTVHVNDQSETIEDFVDTHTGVTAWWDTGIASAVPGDVMASFSSRGPLGDFIKPDVTAPGIQILAGNSFDHLDDPVDGLGPDGELFQAIAGTSMSSPHAAGVAALIKAVHPSWTPGQIKSAMMTSSVQDVLKEDGSTPADPFDRGAGSIRANRAVNPTVTFDVEPVDYYQSAGDPLSRIDLNIASVNAPQMDGIISTTRTVRNVSGTQQTLNLSASGAGGKINLTPNKLSLAPGHSKSFTVFINATGLADGQYFGQIKLDPQTAGYNNAILPVAFLKAPGDVTLSHECESGTVSQGAEVECEVSVTNWSSTDAHVSVRVKSKTPSRIKVNDWSAGNQRPKGFQWNGTLGPALPPSVDGLLTPGDGFYDVSGDLGAGDLYTDEEIGNYGLPTPLRYGDVDYSTVGVVSNGYLVLGGGTSADVEFVPHEFPDPVRPNNVLAPFWTDLNPADGGEVHVGVYSSGIGGAPSFCFYVFQWTGVPVWGTSGAETRTFQVWLMSSACADFFATGGDYITFEYDATDMGPGETSTGQITGAEDVLGLTGVDLGWNVEPDYDGYFIDTGVSTAGGTMTITYDALGKKLGTSKLTAAMTSDVTPGIAKKAVDMTVIP